MDASRDLIIAGQSDPEWDLSPLPDFPEHLAMESGRPVLVVPDKGRHAEFGRNVVIAWKPTRESFTRCVRRSAAAKKCREGANFRVQGARVAADATIAVSLARRGIKPTMQSAAPGYFAVGEQIQSHVIDQGADLLVLGAYGHSRLREIVFGGVTRYVARHMTVPTLFSH